MLLHLSSSLTCRLQTAWCTSLCSRERHWMVAVAPVHLSLCNTSAQNCSPGEDASWRQKYDTWVEIRDWLQHLVGDWDRFCLGRRQRQQGEQEAAGVDSLSCFRYQHGRLQLAVWLNPRTDTQSLHTSSNNRRGVVYRGWKEEACRKELGINF